MRKGDIVFIQGNSIISRIIRMFDVDSNGKKGRFSHVAIAISEKQMIEAEYNSKVSIVNICNHPEKISACEVVDLKINKEERQAIYEESMKFIGRKYDYVQIISYILNKLFGFKLINNKKRFICSELVVASMYQAGLLRGVNYDDVANMTPNQLYEFIKKHSKNDK